VTTKEEDTDEIARGGTTGTVDAARKIDNKRETTGHRAITAMAEVKAAETTEVVTDIEGEEVKPSWARYMSAVLTRL